MTDSDGRTVLNLTVGPDMGRGTMTVPMAKKPTRMEVIRFGDRIFVRSKALWLRQGGQRLADRLGDRWVLGSVARDERMKFISISGVAGILKADGAVTKGGQATVNGRAALVLKDSSDGLLYIAAEGEPLPLRLGHVGGKGQLTFTAYGAPVDRSEPPNYVDPNQPSTS